MDHDATDRNIREISIGNGARLPKDLWNDQDRQEAAAIAGAKAEARGLPVTGNPYRKTPALRQAWASGWTISRQDRSRERIT